MKLVGLISFILCLGFSGASPGAWNALELAQLLLAAFGSRRGRPGSLLRLGSPTLSHNEENLTLLLSGLRGLLCSWPYRGVLGHK